MFIYEKENKLNVVFDGNMPVDTPDMVIYKDADGAHIDFLNATPTYVAVPQETNASDDQL